jgi:hypothetical protein
MDLAIVPVVPPPRDIPRHESSRTISPLGMHRHQLPHGPTCAICGQAPPAPPVALAAWRIQSPAATLSDLGVQIDVPLLGRVRQERPDLMDCLGAKLRVQRIPDHLHALAGRLALEGDNSNGDMANQTGTTAYKSNGDNRLFRSFDKSNGDNRLFRSFEQFKRGRLTRGTGWSPDNLRAVFVLIFHQNAVVATHSTLCGRRSAPLRVAANQFQGARVTRKHTKSDSTLHATRSVYGAWPPTCTSA